jgi:hypothetical protein
VHIGDNLYVSTAADTTISANECAQQQQALSILLQSSTTHTDTAATSTDSATTSAAVRMLAQQVYGTASSYSGGYTGDSYTSDSYSSDMTWPEKALLLAIEAGETPACASSSSTITGGGSSKSALLQSSSAATALRIANEKDQVCT